MARQPKLNYLLYQSIQITIWKKFTNLNFKLKFLLNLPNHLRLTKIVRIKNNFVIYLIAHFKITNRAQIKTIHLSNNNTTYLEVAIYKLIYSYILVFKNHLNYTVHTTNLQKIIYNCTMQN